MGKSHSTPIGVFPSTNVFSKQEVKEITVCKEFEGQPPLGSRFLNLPLPSNNLTFSSKSSSFAFAKAICVAKWSGSSTSSSEL